MAEKQKSKFGKFLLGLFISAVTLGFLGTAGYFTYNAIFKKNKAQHSDEGGITPLNPDENQDGEDNVEINKSKNIVIEKRESDNALIFNRKDTNDSNDLNKNFVIGNLSFLEKPVAKDKNNNPIYFLGQKGLKLLNDMFKKRAIFGPEINAVKLININVNNSHISDDRTNGAYFPSSKEIFIFLKGILDENLELLSKPVEKRVEMIFGVLMHEYTHHIDNMYNKAIKRDDPLSNNDLIEYDGDHDHKHFEVNNEKFLSEFRFNLNYIGNAGDNRLLRSNEDFYYDKDQIPVYRFFSANDLFRAANVNIDLSEKKKYEILDSKKYFFNNNKYQGITFSSPTSIKTIRYTFSMTELFPREIIKLSLGPNAWFYNPSRSLTENFFYFQKENKKLPGLIFNAAGDDILKNLAFLQKTTYPLDRELVTFASNWVFKDQIENFKSNILNHETNTYEKPFKNVGDSRQKGLFKAYIDLMGWGELISFTNYNLNNNKKDYINFGGYFQLPKKLLESKKLDNVKSKIFLVDKDDKNNFMSLDYNINDYNFISKKKWNSIFQYHKDNTKQEDYWDESWIYPDLFNKDYQYVSYFINNINKNTLKSKFKNKKFDIKLWIDLDNNGEYDLNLKDNKEIFSLLNDNNWNNMGNNFFTRYQNNKRRTTTYRKSESQHINSLEYEVFKMSLDTNDKKYYYSIENY
ncbi:hypothetical protein V2E25_03155 [Mycoplasmopsis arginini]|uniref:Uncharacterized protein n=1 Tax=Mycoplasmopsis arginini TaxID=2094 RepID=A0ABZ2AJK0_MYCAR|nr:hypothetical protein [Mycoplasmopsis arginini]WVN21955.1 hypothetical protein V2E25_03155 [Mycoplasmopsis arginini]VEU81967.1 Uncharacterised protein [Mycoplasmopsis arginini]